MINDGRVVDVWRKCLITDETGRVCADRKDNFLRRLQQTLSDMLAALFTKMTLKVRIT